jgi:hypothetical protein
MEEAEIIADLSILEFYLHRLIKLRLNSSVSEDVTCEHQTIANLTTLVDCTLVYILNHALI